MLEYFALPHCNHKPVRANPSDAGLDLKYNPTDILHSIGIEPGQSVILPTGLKFGIPHGYMLQIMNRSGNAAKRSLMVGACVVDAGYDGEVFVNLHNMSSMKQVINPGDKIAQGVVIPVVPVRFMETFSEDPYWYPIAISDRGDGALGSTGR